MNSHESTTFLNNPKELRQQFPDDASFADYLEASRNAMDTVQKLLYEYKNPNEILQDCLQVLIDFYQADWCGMLNTDLEIGAWTPIWWIDAVQGFLSPTHIKGFEIPEDYTQWVEALENRQVISIRNIEELKESHPDEYRNYQRLNVNRVLGAPYYRGSTGFVVIRNPKRYDFQLTPLTMIAYIAATETNELRMMIANQHRLTSEDIRNKNDVVISTFGGLGITTFYGSIEEKDLSINGIGKIIALLAINKGHALSPMKIADTLFSEHDTNAAIISIKNYIYHFRKDYDYLFHDGSKLITTLSNGYALDQNLNIHLDYELLDMFYEAAKKVPDPQQKIFYLRQALKFYKGDLLPNLSDELWLHGLRMHYLSTFLTLTEKLCGLLYDQKDYVRVHEYAAQGLLFAPSSEMMFCWMIRSLNARHMTEIANRELTAARSVLGEASYQHLCSIL